MNEPTPLPNICGFTIDTRPPERILDDVHARMRAGTQTVVACINPHSIAVAERDHCAKEALAAADVRLPDGIGLVWYSRVTGGRIRSRFPGPEFFREFSALCHARGGARFFLLGATEEVLERLTAAITRDFPSIEVVGTLSPPYADRFEPHENERMVAAVNAARPDVLWVGMTQPKQEAWIHEHRHRLQVPLLGAVGAAFDFVAGTKRRQPRLLRRIGLEWLGRLVFEPRRLWRRTFISFPQFVIAAHADRRARRSGSAS